MANTGVACFFDVILFSGVRPYLSAYRILGQIYSHPDKPRPQHFSVRDRVLMIIQPNEGFLGDVLGQTWIANNRTRGPKDSSVMKCERFVKLDPIFRCRRRC